MATRTPTGRLINSERRSTRERFILEAQAASALDHPNICTIHEIDATPEGQQFIAMAYYEGETLKKRLDRGPLSVTEALDVGIQIAQGLKKAHQANIIHRDIKPANVMLTVDGYVKIVDFGIAKLLGVTGPTQTGTTLGTVSYMSPEQVSGDDADQQSDVWALGTVLYEMLTGQQPFKGENHWAVMNAIRQHEPEPPSAVRSEISPEVDQVVLRALAKAKDDRYPSVAEFLSAARSVHAELTQQIVRGPASHTQATRSHTSRLAFGAITVVVAGGLGVFWFANRGVDDRWAREEAIPQAVQLAAQENYTAAFELAEQAAEIVPDDPTLVSLWSEISIPVSLQTTPPGAEIYVRDYADVDGGERLVGTTPLVDTLVPMGAKRWELRKEGFETVFLAAPPDYWQLPLAVRGFDSVVLDEEGGLPPTMVRVPGGPVPAWLTGIDPYSNSAVIGEFLIDRYEVTNAQYKEFIDASGYEDRQYWLHEFWSDGQMLGRDDAMARFVDATGRQGPSTWELGDYPDGEDDYPVTGISWYEAAAYAEFAGKQLPTVLHWVRAAETRLFSFLLPLSNLEGNAPLPVGSSDAISTFGVHDMAGNVREWCWNSSGDRRFILGGGWNDPAYVFTYANVQSPLDRSQTNGVRLVRNLDSEDVLEAVRGPIEPLTRDYAEEHPVADEVFEIYQEQFAYDRTEFNAVAEALPSNSDDWVGERVTLDAAYGSERLMVDVYLPVGFSPPYQAVVVFPGSNAIFESSNPPPGPFDDFVPRSGRALVKPVVKGTYERSEGLLSTWPDESVRYAGYLTNWVRDFSRTIDYLETRPDIDIDGLAYYGISWGGRKGAIIPAVEDRFKAAVLYSGGLASGRARPEADQINYVSRVTIPTLMLNGIYDPIEPVEAAQRPMFDLLGTPEPDKRWVQYEVGHVLPRNDVIRETLDWLDKYLGPVN